jgi:hypothetical protein
MWPEGKRKAHRNCPFGRHKLAVSSDTGAITLLPTARKDEYRICLHLYVDEDVLVMLNVIYKPGKKYFVLHMSPLCSTMEYETMTIISCIYESSYRKTGVYKWVKKML